MFYSFIVAHFFNQKYLKLREYLRAIDRSYRNLRSNLILLVPDLILLFSTLVLSIVFLWFNGLLPSGFQDPSVLFQTQEGVDTLKNILMKFLGKTNFMTFLISLAAFLQEVDTDQIELLTLPVYSDEADLLPHREEAGELLRKLFGNSFDHSAWIHYRPPAEETRLKDPAPPLLEKPRQLPVREWEEPTELELEETEPVTETPPDHGNEEDAAVEMEEIGESFPDPELSLVGEEERKEETVLSFHSG